MPLNFTFKMAKKVNFLGRIKKNIDKKTISIMYETIIPHISSYQSNQKMLELDIMSVKQIIVYNV